MNQKQIYNPDHDRNSVCATDMRAYAFSTRSSKRVRPLPFNSSVESVERVFQGVLGVRKTRAKKQVSHQGSSSPVLPSLLYEVSHQQTNIQQFSMKNIRNILHPSILQIRNHIVGQLSINSLAISPHSSSLPILYPIEKHTEPVTLTAYVPGT